VQRLRTHGQLEVFLLRHRAERSRRVSVGGEAPDYGASGLLVPRRSGASVEAYRPAEHSETGQRDHCEDHTEYRCAHREEDAAHERAQDECDDRDDGVQPQCGLPVSRARPVVRAAEAWHGPVGRVTGVSSHCPAYPPGRASTRGAVAWRIPPLPVSAGRRAARRRTAPKPGWPSTCTRPPCRPTCRAIRPSPAPPVRGGTAMLPKCVAVLGLARGDVLPGIKTTHARGGTAGQAGAHSTRLPCTSRRRTSSRRPSGPRRRGTLRSRREYSPPAATHWIDRLARAHHTGQLETELKKIHRYKLIIIDEVGYIFRHRRREPVLRARHFPLRDRLDPGHQQPALRSLGRGVRRRDRRRHHDRPPRPPRRGPHLWVPEFSRMIPDLPLCRRTCHGMISQWQ